MKVRYHIPSRANWEVEPPSDERTRLESVITSAIERAVKSKAQQGSDIVATKTQRSGTIGDLVGSSRHEPQTGDYAIPSYNPGGNPEAVPALDSDQ